MAGDDEGRDVIEQPSLAQEVQIRGVGDVIPPALECLHRRERATSESSQAVEAIVRPIERDLLRAARWHRPGGILVQALPTETVVGLVSRERGLEEHLGRPPVPDHEGSESPCAVSSLQADDVDAREPVTSDREASSDVPGAVDESGPSCQEARGLWTHRECSAPDPPRACAAVVANPEHLGSGRGDLGRAGLDVHDVPGPPGVRRDEQREGRDRNGPAVPPPRGSWPRVLEDDGIETGAAGYSGIGSGQLDWKTRAARHPEERNEKAPPTQESLHCTSHPLQRWFRTARKRSSPMSQARAEHRSRR